MDNLELVVSCLENEDAKKILKISEELKDSYAKRQLFRTDTEARISVLNDGNFPTKASKYWQAVREQTAMLENLVYLNLELRKNDLEIRRTVKKLQTTQDQFDREELQIELDTLRFSRLNMEATASDRVREITMWSTIKNELDDGTFNTKDVNEHQAESYLKTLENRAKTLTPGSSQSEVLNVYGPLETTQRLLMVSSESPHPTLKRFNDDEEEKKMIK